MFRSLFLALALAACSSSSQPQPESPPAPAPTPATPTPTPTPAPPTPTPAPTPPAPAPPPPSKPRAAIPTPDRTCASDADCVLTDDDLTGPTACCGGCESHAMSKAGLAAFTAACKASPPEMCPPTGCAMPIVKAACVAGRCEAKPASH